MKITVAVPSYNKEKYIERCLASIVHEKEYIDTILLVDNNSTDRTFDLSRQFEPAVTCIKNDTNLGMSGNWNKCIDLCTTEWLMIVHADDEMVPGAMAHYKKIIEKYPTAGIIYGNAYSMVEDDESTKTMSPSSQKEFWKAGKEAMACKPSVCSAVMVRKDAYTQLGYFIDKSLSSDVEMWHRIASKYDTVFLNVPTVIYRVSASSTGYDSLINRNIKDIKKDWDKEREEFLADCYRRAPGSYFAVAKANIRARNYMKVLETLWLIIFTYNGFFPLISMITAIIKKRLVLIFKQ